MPIICPNCNEKSCVFSRTKNYEHTIHPWKQIICGQCRCVIDEWQIVRSVVTSAQIKAINKLQGEQQ